jgi:hypothetical protein
MTDVKIPFDALEGLPGDSDLAVAELMKIVSSLPEESHLYTISLLMRAAVAWERTGNAQYLTMLAQDVLVTTRLRRDSEVDRALRNAPTKPAAPEDTVNVREFLKEQGL